MERFVSCKVCGNTFLTDHHKASMCSDTCRIKNRDAYLVKYYREHKEKYDEYAKNWAKENKKRRAVHQKRHREKLSARIKRAKLKLPGYRLNHKGRVIKRRISVKHEWSAFLNKKREELQKGGALPSETVDTVETNEGGQV